MEITEAQRKQAVHNARKLNKEIWRVCILVVLLELKVKAVIIDLNLIFNVVFISIIIIFHFI